MALVQPKRGAGGAYAFFIRETRAAFAEKVKGQAGSAVSKLGGEAWKKLSEEERAPYEAKYAAAKAKFETDMEAFLAAGGVKKKGLAALRTARRKAKEAALWKRNHDPSMAPQRPDGAARDIWLRANRVSLAESLPAGHTKKDLAKAAAERWKALPNAEKKPFEEKYEKKKVAYQAALKEFRKTDVGEAEEKERRTFGIWLRANRVSLAESLPAGHTKKDLAEAAAERWKALPIAEKTPFEEKYEKKMLEKDCEDKDEKTSKPPANAYGIWLNENRARIADSLPADHRKKDLAKAAAEMWEQFPDVQKKLFEEEYERNKVEYKAALKEYRKTKRREAEEEDGKTPGKQASQPPSKEGKTTGGDDKGGRVRQRPKDFQDEDNKAIQPPAKKGKTTGGDDEGGEVSDRRISKTKTKKGIQPPAKEGKTTVEKAGDDVGVKAIQPPAKEGKTTGGDDEGGKVSDRRISKTKATNARQPPATTRATTRAATMGEKVGDDEGDNAIQPPAKEGKTTTEKAGEDEDEKTRKPPANAYGFWLNENRARIADSLPAGHKKKDLAKAAAEMWKELPDAQHKLFDQLYKNSKDAYKAGLKANRKIGGREAEEEDGKTTGKQAIQPPAEGGKTMVEKTGDDEGEKAVQLPAREGKTTGGDDEGGEVSDRRTSKTKAAKARQPQAKKRKTTGA